MINIRRITLVLALLAASTLGCQTVTNLLTGTPTPRPQPTMPPEPTLAPEATQPEMEDTPTAEGEVPTQPDITMPTLPALPLGAGATLSSPADTENILAGSSVPKTLEELSAQKYTDQQYQQMNHTFPFPVVLSSEQPALWQWGWCATTQDILDQNLKEISVAFSMNGQPVSLDQFYVFDSQSTDSQGNTLPCHNWATVASKWPKGATALQTVVTFADKINDGMNDYPAGKQTFIYAVMRQ